MTAVDDVAAFVERVRARRHAVGKPEQLEDDSLYRILDGLLSTRPRPAGGKT